MLRSRQEIHPHVVGEREILCAVDARVGERRRPPAAPVLDGRVRVKDLGPLLGAIGRLQSSMHAVGVGFVGIGKWKARRSEHITVARRRESLVVRSARRAGDVGPHCIEHPPVLLVRVEAVVQELTEEAASLRLAVGIRGTAAHGKITSIAEGRCRVADGGEANTGDDRAGRAIGDPIPATGIESAVELNPGWRAVARDETPSLSSDDGGLVPEAISNRQTILRARRVRRRIHHRRSHRIIDEECFRGPGVHKHIHVECCDFLGGRQHGRRRDDAQRCGGDIGFPSDPHDGVALPHKQSVAKVRQGRWAGTARRHD